MNYVPIWSGWSNQKLKALTSLVNIISPDHCLSNQIKNILMDLQHITPKQMVLFHIKRLSSIRTHPVSPSSLPRNIQMIHETTSCESWRSCCSTTTGSEPISLLFLRSLELRFPCSVPSSESFSWFSTPCSFISQFVITGFPLRRPTPSSCCWSGSMRLTWITVHDEEAPSDQSCVWMCSTGSQVNALQC